MTVSLGLVREAFDRAGEKRFLLAQLLYPLVFGPAWRDAVLTFAYLKCLDDVVDEDPDAERALAVLARQRVMLARAYAGDAADAGVGAPERFGLPVFERDRARGARLRGLLEGILATMEFDTRRRGAWLDAAALDTYVIELGSSVFGLFAQLAKPGTTLPPAFVTEGSRAYLYGDALIDLRHDLALGVINVPREDIDRYRLSGAPDDEGLRAWVAGRAPEILGHFARASAQARQMRPRGARLFLRLALAAKRRKLRRFLARGEAGRAGHAAATAGINGNV